MFSTILVPIDIEHKDWAANALTHVNGVDNENIRIILLYVAHQLPGYVTTSLPAELLKQNRDKVQQELDEFAKDIGKNVEAEVRQGSPASVILREAERLAADLIVIGSHQPGLSDYFLGSTASRVVRHAKCSVLVSR